MMRRFTLTLSLVVRYLWLVISILLLISLFIEPKAITVAVLCGLVVIGTVSYYRKNLAGPWKTCVDWISSICLESCSLVATLAFYLFGMINLDQKKAVGAASTPILLVHGYMHNRSAWLYLRYRLKCAGVGPIFTINLGYPFLSIEEYAKRIEKKAKDIETLTHRRDLILIGHSMGGLVSAYYAAHLASLGTVSDIITLGTPAQGTKIAAIGLGACAREMECQSAFVKALNRDVDRCAGTRFFSVGSSTDLFIIPHSSAHFTSNKVKKMTIPDQGHLHYLYSDVIADNLVTYLQWQRVMSAGSIIQSPRRLEN